jgi:hypothetical protein
MLEAHVTNSDQDDEISAAFDRLERERDAAYEQGDEYFAELQRERKARQRLTRRIHDVLQEDGVW